MMKKSDLPPDELSSWWRKGVFIILLVEFAVLIWITTGTYFRDVGPPIPDRVEDTRGRVIFTGEDIIAGQELFLKRALMNNGSIWGHGAYIGPDFSAQYLHHLALATRKFLSTQVYDKPWDEINEMQKESLQKATFDFLSENRYQKESDVLVFTEPEIESFKEQQLFWKNYFETTEVNKGLSATLIKNPEEFRQLVSFFGWAAWASTAHVPGKDYSYTNNFPYEPIIGNGPSTAAILWSALSLIALLAGIALILLAFGGFHYLGWRKHAEIYPPQMLPGKPTRIQLNSIKFFIAATAILLLQALFGAAMAHYLADPGSFFGMDLSKWFPTNVLRSWHLQTAILWIATAYMGGGLFLSSVLSHKEQPKGQIFLINFLFVALAILVIGSLTGQFLGVADLMGDLWFWLGNQGWEYLEIGRGWQILMAVGLLLWAIMLYRGVKPALQIKKEKEITILFLLAAFAIPFFYLPAFFFDGSTDFTTVETWRFWIIHLWVEGFFELFATVMVAVMFYKLGLVLRVTALRIIYLDAILFLGAGILGTGHHWYWTGQTTFSMAVSATFSALEVVPLILLTLEAADFVRLMRPKHAPEEEKMPFPHKWTFYFLIAVGVWNFVGAGIFGFLINLPVVSYFQAGTNLTANHGHAALMGVFGMLGMAFLVFAIRQVQSDKEWAKIEKWVKWSFWGLNIGLLGMVVFQLFPSGVLQMKDVIQNGYWHARSIEFTGQKHIQLLAWLRLPADVVFIVVGVLPMLYAVSLTWLNIVRKRKKAITES